MPHSLPKSADRVVQLSDYHDRRLKLAKFAQDRLNSRSVKNTAEITDLNDRIGCFASIEIDELSALTPLADRLAVLDAVRDHLTMEFGPNHITQTSRSFTVRHRNLEEMISALLRVQYHVYQCSPQDLAAIGVPESFQALNLTWGVGTTVIDADSERLKRRRRKRFRHDG